MDIYEPRLLMEAYAEVYQSQDVDTELYEQVVEFLINEGYVNNLDDADSLIEELSDEEIEGILSEANRGEQRLGGKGLEPVLVRSNRMAAYAGEPLDLTGDDEVMRKNPHYVSGHRRGGNPTLASTNPRIEQHNTKRGVRKVRGMKEELDTYDLVLDHLISEGYADTEDAALQIMAHMSEEWVDGIIDEAVRGSERSIGNRITGMDIRSVNRGGRSVYKKPGWEDRVETQVRREMGRGGHRNPFQYGSEATPQAKRSVNRLNAATNIEDRQADGDYANPIDYSNPTKGKSGYMEVPTDHRVRRRRASGR